MFTLVPAFLSPKEEEMQDTFECTVCQGEFDFNDVIQAEEDDGTKVYICGTCERSMDWTEVPEKVS